MLTKKDLDQIRGIVDETLEIKLETKLEEKLETKLEEKLGRFPTKEEFYKAMDKLMGELKNHRDERAAMKFRFDDHGEKIEALEKIHPANQHPHSPSL